MILPRKTILFSDLSSHALKKTQSDSKDKDNHDKAEREPLVAEEEADSLNGLGGYHGSIHVDNGRNGQTIYYSVNAYAERMDNGRTNGIVVFDEPWKNIAFVLYHELNEARTDPDVDDGNNERREELLGWTSERGDECGDFPITEAFRSGNPRLIIKEVEIDGNLVPIQLQYSNFVHGPEGPIPNPHPRNTH